MIDIGLGFFLEVSMDEAKPLIAKRKKFYEEKSGKINEDIVKAKLQIVKVIRIFCKFLI